MKILDVLAAALLVTGGVNLGIVGLVGFDFIAAASGEISFVTRFAYLLVGACALYQALAWRAIQRRWALAWARYY